MNEERVIVLEQQFGNLHANVGRVEEKIDNIAETLNALVRIDERQSMINERLDTGGVTMRDHETRLQMIETAMPGLREVRRWVVTCLLSCVAMLAAALIKLVLIK